MKLAFVTNVKWQNEELSIRTTLKEKRFAPY